MSDSVLSFSPALAYSSVMGIIEYASVLLLIALIAGAWTLVATYNRLVRLRQRQSNAFAQIDVQLKRRHDLVPSLVNTVKGYMQHERATLEAVVLARQQARAAVRDVAAGLLDAALASRLGEAESVLSATLEQLRVVVEAYPQLRAAENTRQLMEELGSTENRIAFARQAYNDAVMVYNTARETFPTLLVAGLFGFRPAFLLQFSDNGLHSPVAVALP